MKKLVLIGGGGHCRSVIDVIEATGEFEIMGILDGGIDAGSAVLNSEILGGDELISKLADDGVEFLITIGQIKNSDTRQKLFETVKKANGKFATITAPSAHVSNHSKIGEGTIVMHNCLVNAATEIGNNNIINTGTIIEHDCHVGDHCHISTSVTINGTCKIGSHSFIGSKVCVNHGVEIGEKSVIASGSLVNKNLPGNNIYMGVPVKLS